MEFSPDFRRSGSNLESKACAVFRDLCDKCITLSFQSSPGLTDMAIRALESLAETANCTNAGQSRARRVTPLLLLCGRHRKADLEWSVFVHDLVIRRHLKQRWIWLPDNDIRETDDTFTSARVRHF
jgi:hypothetical protein